MADGPVDPRLVLTLAASGDADALRVAERVGATLARVVGVLGSMYDPARVIICGAVAESIEPVLAAARRILPDELHLPAPEILASTLGAEVVSAGAIATARRAARSVPSPPRGTASHRLTPSCVSRPLPSRPALPRENR